LCALAPFRAAGYYRRFFRSVITGAFGVRLKPDAIVVRAAVEIDRMCHAFS